MNGLGSFWVNTISCTGVFVKVKCYVYVVTSIHVLLYCFCIFILFYMYLIQCIILGGSRSHYLSHKQWSYMLGDGTGDALIPPSTCFVGWWRRDSKAPRLLHGQFKIINMILSIHVHFSDFFNKIMIFYCSVIFQTSFQRNADHSYWVTKYSMLPKVTTNLLYKLQQGNPMIN